ncbi:MULTISPECIES: hypothetical protein [Bacillus cereus group]|uniref:Uncharacterized protein n=1 Tax=Bacillus cereus TaxID=1396 RepID=A0A9X6VW36_BACCE|nr:MULTISPECIES: hypothetical protein [Bacillus cereus group]PEZ75411.1 hypothetical protein CN410_15235 [Bacillus anthracis]PFA29600.1 hypothetical protein CN384_07875 [Bacillus thuringiensis]PFF45966.1 hypothetical protein CN357_21145 [Bacillus cereus]PFQ36560.1 hypothetical protein COK33_17510 [Bacillus cereus]PGB07074.1 hypothetical protein COM09_31620 [Bacillus toyonensis]
MSGVITFLCILVGGLLLLVGTSILISAIRYGDGVFFGVIAIFIGFILITYPISKADIERGEKINNAITKELHVDDSEYKIVNRNDDIYEVATKTNRYKFYFNPNGTLFKVEKIKDSESLHDIKESEEKTNIREKDIISEVKKAVAKKLNINNDDIIIEKESDKDNRYIATTSLGVYYVQTSEGTVNVDGIVKKK